MPKTDFACLLGRLQTVVPEKVSDRQLLDRFLHQRDDSAFSELVERHGAMVLGVCRRIVGSTHDAEDAFQATFLLLAQKAGRLVPHEALGPWLHSVACRVALKAKTMLRRRQHHERQAVRYKSDSISDVLPHHDLRSILDQELQKLPAMYRALVVLCDLQGNTFRQVARQLELPVGTLSGRLKKGRQLLAERLSRRGIALSTSVLALMLAEQATAQVPALLASTVTRTAAAWMAAESMTPGLVTASVQTLVKGTAMSMIWNHLKLTSCLAALVVVFSVGWLYTGPTIDAQDKVYPNPVSPPRVRIADQELNQPSYLIEMEILQQKGKEFESISSPKIVVMAHQKATVQFGQMDPLLDQLAKSKVSFVGFEAEVEVRPKDAQTLVLDMKCSWRKVRNADAEELQTLTYSTSIVKAMTVDKQVEILCDPFGRPGKILLTIKHVQNAETKLDVPDKKPQDRAFPLKHLHAHEAACYLAWQFPKDAIVQVNNNKLYVHATPAVLAQCEELLQKVDALPGPISDKQNQLVKLQYADANALSKSLQNIMKQNATVLADPRTNTLILNADKEYLDQVKKLIEKLDQANAPMKP